MFYTWSLLFMQIRFRKMLKLTNLSCRMNIQFHVWKVKFWPKTEILNMASQVEISYENVSIQNNISFMSFGWKCVNAISNGWVGLMEFDERKVLKFGENMLWVEKTSESRWEVLVFVLRNCFSLKKHGWNGKTWKIEAKSSFLPKTQVNSQS